MITNVLIPLAALYHLLATAVALMSVFHFIRMLRGDEERHPLWRTLFSQAEAHLWLSGALLVGLGLYATGLYKYLNNPKLWTKLSLITVWGLNSLWMKRALAQALPRQRHLMFGMSLGSLLYGSFLGVAKPLAYGVWPFAYFLLGYGAVVLLCTLVVQRLLQPAPTRWRPA